MSVEVQLKRCPCSSSMGRICGVCGEIGEIEKLVACSVCETACEHTNGAQPPAPSNPAVDWYCQTCRKKQVERSSLKRQLPYRPAPIAWKGSLEVREMTGNTVVELVAYFPFQVSSKLYGAIKSLPEKLEMKMVPCYHSWPKRFEIESPTFEDIGIYLLPSDKWSGLKCSHILRQLDSKNLALKTTIRSRLQLVVYSSQILEENSQRTGENIFFWGFFWKRKMITPSKKNKYTSPSNIRTPIARDKRAEIPDISDAHENNLVEEEVADISDVPPGFTRHSVGHETSAIDKQSETSMPGMESPSVDQGGVAPGFSPSSSIGVGAMKATIEESEKQKECCEDSCIADASLEKRAEEAGSERVPQQLNNTLPGFGASGPMVSEHEKEPLVPLPVGLEMPPGFSRRVETREQKDFSNRSRGSPLSMDQVLDAARSEPHNFMSRSPLGNQGIVPQKMPAGDPVIQGTPSESCNTQPTSLGGIPGTSLYQSQRIQTTSNLGTKGNPMPQFMKPKKERITPDEVFSLKKEGPVLQGNQNYQYKGASSGFSPQAHQDPSPIPREAQNQNENHHLFVGPYNANIPSLTHAPPHFRFLNPCFLASSLRSDVYHPSIKKETADISDVAIGEGSNQRREFGRPNQWSETMTPRRLYRSPSRRTYRSLSRSPVPRQRQKSRSRGSPSARRQRSPSRSPAPKWRRSPSRSPAPRRQKSRSRRSPSRRRWKSPSRSPAPRRRRSPSRSPVRRWRRSPSRSPGPRRRRIRSRSPGPRWRRSRSRSYSRRHRSRYRNQDSGCYRSRYRRRSKGDSSSSNSSQVRRSGRERSRSISPPPSS